MRDHLYRIEYDPIAGPVLWVRYVEDNDRGDEDPSEPARWTLSVTVLDPVTFLEPLQSITWTHKVNI